MKMRDACPVKYESNTFMSESEFYWMVAHPFEPSSTLKFQTGSVMGIRSKSGLQRTING